jgi:ethanolamine permease
MGNSLKASLGSWHIWGLAIGLGGMGEYFGWSYGWDKAGTLGFLMAAIFVSVMYIAFIFSFAELAAAIPQAGGPFAYARRAFGKKMAFVAGFSTLVEFLFAPPAIAMAIGAYFNFQFHLADPKIVALAVYAVFISLNILGVRLAATLELIMAVLAVLELLVFMGVVGPSFSMANFVAHGWAGENHFSMSTFHGIFAAIPFAIWLFLAIEGAAMAAEETENPQENIPKAFLSAILTLVFLAIGVIAATGGVSDWRLFSNINDPLPQAMKAVVGANSPWLHMLVMVGLFGLLASFNGIVLAYSRQIFALSRAGFLPKSLGVVNKKFQTPHTAIIAGGLVGSIAILGNSLEFDGQPLTANLITMSVLGAVIMYITSMMSLFVLRAKEPDLNRPYRAICYPVFPAIALLFAFVCLATIFYYNLKISFVFFGLMAVTYFVFTIIDHQYALSEEEELLLGQS